MRKKCSGDREERLKFEVEARGFARDFEIIRTIYLNCEMSEQFLKQIAFLTWRFLRFDTQEQL